MSGQFNPGTHLCRRIVNGAVRLLAEQGRHDAGQKRAKLREGGGQVPQGLQVRRRLQVRQEGCRQVPEGLPEVMLCESREHVPQGLHVREESRRYVSGLWHGTVWLQERLRSVTARL